MRKKVVDKRCGNCLWWKRRSSKLSECREPRVLPAALDDFPISVFVARMGPGDGAGCPCWERIEALPDDSQAKKIQQAH